MNPRSNPRWIYLLITLALLALGGFYFWNVWKLKQVETQMLAQLQRQANLASSLAARMFDGTVLETLRPGDETTTPVLYYQQLLWELTTEGGVSDAALLTLDGRLLVDARTQFTIGDSLVRFPIEPSRWTQAINGQIPPPQLVATGDGYVLVTYTPITHPLVGNPVAVLVAVYPTQFFATFLEFKQQLMIQALAGIGVLIAFALILVFSIRQLIRTERRLLEQQRLAELGQMSAMVAHEIRNPLSIIKGSAEVLRKQYRHEANELFDFIPQEIDRLNRLVNNFLTFARKQTLNIQPIPLYPLIEQQLQLLNDARITLKGDPTCRVAGDEDALKQVVLNVLNNARKAIEPRGDAGKIEIEVASSANGEYVLLSVRDNGIGMDAETVKRVFQPFFSQSATGSGLGLTITRQLVERMGGHIEIESEKDKGTTVRIWLKESRR